MRLRSVSLAMVAATAPLTAQERTAGAVLLQVDVAGLFIRLAGNALADASVDRLTVRRWRPGLTVAYQWRQQVQVAVYVKPGLHLLLEERYGFGDVKDGRAAVDHVTGAIMGAEARFFVRSTGFYGGLGLHHARPTRYDLVFRRDGATMRAGTRDYPTDLVASWSSRSRTTPSMSAGYSMTPRRGLGLFAGVSVPMGFPRQSPATLRFDPGIPVDPADQRAVASAIERELFYGPVAFHLGFGLSVR